MNEPTASPSPNVAVRVESPICHFCLSSFSPFWKRHKASGNILCSECYKIDKSGGGATSRTPSPAANGALPNRPPLPASLGPPASASSVLISSSALTRTTPMASSIISQKTKDTKDSLAGQTVGLVSSPHGRNPDRTTSLAENETATQDNYTVITALPPTSYLSAGSPILSAMELVYGPEGSSSFSISSTGSIDASTTSASPLVHKKEIATAVDPELISTAKGVQDSDKCRGTLTDDEYRRTSTDDEGEPKTSPAKDDSFESESVLMKVDGETLASIDSGNPVSNWEINVVCSDEVYDASPTTEENAPPPKRRDNLELIVESLNEDRLGEDDVVDNIFKRVAKSLVSKDRESAKVADEGGEGVAIVKPRVKRTPKKRRFTRPKISNAASAKIISMAALDAEVFSSSKLTTAIPCSPNKRKSPQAAIAKSLLDSMTSRKKREIREMQLKRKRKERRRRVVKKASTPEKPETASKERIGVAGSRKRVAAGRKLKEVEGGVDGGDGGDDGLVSDEKRSKAEPKAVAVTTTTEDEMRKSKATSVLDDKKLRSGVGVVVTSEPVPLKAGVVEEDSRKARVEARSASAAPPTLTKRKVNGKNAGRSKVGRRNLFFKQRGSVNRGPKRVASIVTQEMVYFRHQFWQKGDIVSVVDADDEQVYYAQIRGFVQDQYCEKSAVLTWLLPTLHPNYDGRLRLQPGFHPESFIAGPEEDLPRRMECMEFVCRAPSDYFRPPLGTFGAAPFPVAHADVESDFERRRRDLGFVWYSGFDKDDEEDVRIQEIPSNKELFLGNDSPILY